MKSTSAAEIVSRPPKLRWGVLGTAKIALQKVIPAMQQGSRCEVTALASRSYESARRAAAKLGIPRACGSYPELLQDPDIDAVYIPLPNHLHAEWTMAAARAGKHVLCEKPAGLTSAQVRAMVECCRQQGVLFMEAFMYKLHPQWQRVLQIVDAGRLGVLKAVDSFFSYRNLDPENIRNIQEYGGGGLMDIGCYCINLSRMLFRSEPEEVSGQLEFDPAMKVDRLASGLLRFPRGQATFTCGTQIEPDQRVHLHGTEGRLLVEIPFNIPPDRPTRLLLTAGGDPPENPHTEVIEIPAANQYTIQGDLFSQAVLEGSDVPIPPEDAIANLLIIERLRGLHHREHR